MKKVILFPLLMFAVCSSILAQNALEPAVYGNYANDSKDALDQYYNEKRTKLLHLNRFSCGVYVNQSFRQEGVLGYDSVKHVLVYNESIKNIWSQAYRERMELTQTGENSFRWTMREKPKKPWAIPVAYHQMRIPDDLASDLQALWTNAISAAREDSSQVLVLDGTSYDCFVRGPKPMYARTNGWANKRAPESPEYLVHRLLRLHHQLIEAVKKGNRRALEALRIDIRFLADDFRHDVAAVESTRMFRYAF